MNEDTAIGIKKGVPACAAYCKWFYLGACSPKFDSCPCVRFVREGITRM